MVKNLTSLNQCVQKSKLFENIFVNIFLSTSAVADPEGFQGPPPPTPPPCPRLKISYENEIIWSYWDQIISFSWDVSEK